jgi:transposase
MLALQTMLADQLDLINEQILESDRRILTNARSADVGRRLMEIPGVGPVLANAVVATVADPAVFKSGRNLAAWVGLVPRQNSSGGKERLGRITKMGDRYLRKLLFVGMMSLVRRAKNKPESVDPRLIDLLAQKLVRLAAVALANKTARIIWAIMARGGTYSASHVPTLTT